MSEEKKRMYEAILRDIEERKNRKKKKRGGRVLRFCQGCFDETGGHSAAYRIKCFICDRKMREATPEEIREYKKYDRLYAKEDANHREREATWKKRKKLGR